MNNFALMQQTVDELETIVQQLATSFPPPLTRTFGDNGLVLRHHPNDRSNHLVAFMKAVSIVSHLNAALVLLAKGYVQEVYILCRVIDDAVQDISFMLHDFSGTSTLKKQKEYLNNFYQEELDDPNDPLSSSKRAQVARADIQSALSNVRTGFSNPYAVRRVTNALFKTFSGFVHGSYVFLIEMFDRQTLTFRMNGFLGTARMNECSDNFVNHLYRSIITVATVGLQTNRKDVAKAALLLASAYSEKSGMADDQTRESLARSLALAEAE